jgi:hypothetical protein
VVNPLVLPGPSAAWHVHAQRRRTALLTGLALFTSVVLAGLLLLFELVSLTTLLLALSLAITLWRPRVGVYVAFGLVVLFEAGNGDQLMLPGDYLHTAVGRTLELGGIVASPLELLLLLLLAVWLGQGIAQHRLDFRRGRLFVPMLLFSLALLLGLAHGRLGGGDMYIAMWEARYLFSIPLWYILATNLIRTRRQVELVTTIGLLSLSFFAIDAAYRRVALIDTGQLGDIKEFYYQHESVVFLGTLILLILAQNVFGGPRWQRLLGLLLIPVALYGLLATERRSAYIALLIGFLIFSLVFLVVRRRAFFWISVPVLIGVAIYLPIFWNNTSMVGQPARAIRSLYQPDPRDAASNAARDAEKANIRATIAANPLLGVGFGQQYYYWVVPTVDLSWWALARYETHANILWVWLKTGIIGFILFWLLMGAAIAYATHCTRTLREPTLRTFALVTLGGIIATLVFAYVDLALTGPRVPMFLGTMIGTLAVIDQVHE